MIKANQTCHKHFNKEKLEGMNLEDLTKEMFSQLRPIILQKEFKTTNIMYKNKTYFVQAIPYAE